MSDTLEERLNRHSDAFQGLLSLIPAKYYFDEDTETQWQRKKTSKGEKKSAKRAKLDPESQSSAASEAQRRSQAALEAQDESDSDLSVIYDDNGNEIRLRPDRDEEDAAEPTGDANEDTHLLAQQPKQPQQKSDPAKEPKKKETQPKLQPKPKQPKDPKQKKQKESKPNGQVNGVAAPIEAPVKAPSEAPSETLSASSDNSIADAKKQGIQKLREQLLNRIDELKAKRKAPGTAVEGAARNREELLAQRKQRLEQKKQKLKRKREEDPEVDINDEGIKQQPETAQDDIIFGGVDFKDGAKIDKNLELAADKKLKKRNAMDQLKVLENRKKKLENLDEDKRREIEEKAQWSRMILQSEGAKLKDDEKLLRKTVKQQKNKKLKSEKEWNERKQKVSDGIAAREAKRNQNIANHTLIKQAKGKNQKKKLRQRAGFEGKKRRKN